MGAASELVALLRVYWALFLGNIVEWYEFAIYGYLVHALEDQFFRGSSVATWLGYAVSFVARPLGGVVLGFAGDRLGRSAAVNISFAGMLIGTVGQGCVPSFASGNIAGTFGLALLVVLRFLQGLCAAGEISTISTYITEVGSPGSLGRSISLISITANLGFLLANASVYAVTAIFGEAAVHAWAWRVPYILALVPGLVAVVGRRAMPESGAFLEHRRQKEERQPSADEEDAEEAPAPGAAKAQAPAHWQAAPLGPWAGNIVLGICGVAAHGVFQYGGFVFLQAYLKQRGLAAVDGLWAGLCARILMSLLALPVGWLVDRKGVAWVNWVGALMTLLGGLPLFMLLQEHPSDSSVAILVLGVACAIPGVMAGATIFLYLVELFPVAVRGTAVGISWNVGMTIFGGFAPILAQASLGVTPFGPGLILSFGGLVSACSISWSLCRRRSGGQPLTHVRHVPYFSSSLLCKCFDDSKCPDDSKTDAPGESLQQ